MAIITGSRKKIVKKPSPVRSSAVGAQPIQAGRSITSSVRSRQGGAQSRITAAISKLPAQKQPFAMQLQANCRRASQVPIMGATNTTNIAARPEFIELLPVFVQKLLILDIFGSVAMKSRQQFVPYFKVLAENTKGETAAGDILNSPMVNRQGLDANFSGRVVKNEILSTEAGTFTGGNLMYAPVLPGSVTIQANIGGNISQFIDDGFGSITDATGGDVGTIEYDTGAIDLSGAGVTLSDGDIVKAFAYQYDNENVGPDINGNYGAKMGKFYLQLDEFNLIAEAHQLASYWSIYAAFAAKTEYGANIDQMAKDAAFSEIASEINTQGFKALEEAARYKPQYNWDASPVVNGSVVPTDYLNMFKMKLGQAAASIYQATRLSTPNILTVGANVGEYIKMMKGFTPDSTGDNVGPYKLGTLDQFQCFLEPNYDPNKWVMSCKSSDIRRNSGLFGEYMPLVPTDPITLADGTVQQGYASMYALQVVNPDTVVSGKIVGIF